jgi:hypothetical protein
MTSSQSFITTPSVVRHKCLDIKYYILYDIVHEYCRTNCAFG